MKHAKVFFGILTLIFGCSTSDDGLKEQDLGLDPALETKEAKKMVATNNAFAFDFFKEIANTEAAENYMVSPLSLSLALGMTYNGADGDTNAAFGDVLDYADVDAANSFNHNLIKSLTASGSGAVLNLAQAIWIKDDFPVEADFAKINKQASLQISKVLQKTFIEVNEEGTEAAAVTSVEVILTSSAPGLSFIADHPFLYMIRDSYTESICFVGRVGKP